MEIKIQMEKSWNNFIFFLTNFQKEIKEQILDEKKALSNISKIKILITNPTIEKILEVQDILISLNPNLKIQLEMLDFFAQNGIFDIDQLKIVVRNICDDRTLKTFLTNNSELSEKIKNLESRLLQCNTVISGKASFQNVVDLVEISSLSEEDKINVIGKFVYDASPNLIKNSTLLESDVETLEIDLTYSVEEDFLKYNVVLKRINYFMSKYYNFVLGKNDKQIKYAKSVAAMANEDPNILKEAKYKDQIIISLVVELIENKEMIEEEFKIIEDKNSVSREIKEMIEYYLTNLNDLLANLSLCDQQLNKDNIAQQTADNIIFLEKNDDTLLFNIADFSKEDQNRIKKLLIGLKNNKKDYEKGIKHSKVLTKSKIPFDIYVNKNGAMCVAYILLNSKNFLVLTFGSIEDIYKLAESICYKYNEKIKNWKTMNIEDLLSRQEILRNELFNILQIERSNHL